MEEVKVLKIKEGYHDGLTVSKDEKGINYLLEVIKAELEEMETDFGDTLIIECGTMSKDEFDKMPEWQ